MIATTYGDLKLIRAPIPDGFEALQTPSSDCIGSKIVAPPTSLKKKKNTSLCNGIDADVGGGRIFDALVVRQIVRGSLDKLISINCIGIKIYSYQDGHGGCIARSAGCCTSNVRASV